MNLHSSHYFIMLRLSFLLEEEKHNIQQQYASVQQHRKKAKALLLI